MLPLAPEGWVRAAIPTSRYRLAAMSSDGEALRLHIRTQLRGQRCSLVADLTPQQLTFHRPPALPPPLLRAVLQDLQQRLLPNHAAIARDIAAARQELARRAADPAWAALRRLADGLDAGPRVPLRPGRLLPVHTAALGALQRLLDDDEAEFESFYLHLSAAPAVDARIMAAVALAAGDLDAAATFRPLPGEASKPAVWRWLQGARQREAPGPVTPLPLPERVQVAARAVWHWGGAARPAQPVFGSPLARGQQKPRLPRTPATARYAERFQADGFVAIRGALSRARAAAWAQRMIGHFQHARAADPSLGEALTRPQALSLSEPDAGFGGLLRWRTGRSIPLHLFSVELAALVDALVGLEHLYSNVSDQLLITRDILKLPPSPQPCWHLDEAPADGRIDNQRLAALALVLLTDVEEEDGPTVFLPESPPLVADALAQSAGLDLDDRRWTAKIGARCTRRVLATGKAGDVFLLHPMTLHARHRPVRTSLRIIANVNLHAHQPLSYTQPQSAVERYARR